MAAVEEDNFFGKHSGVEPEPHRWEHVVIAAPDPNLRSMGWQQAAGGYAAVWATENTREAIFDAMKRKETYATTGPRMVVRFFGGWDFTAEDAEARLPGRGRLRQGSSDGRRSAPSRGRQVSELPRRRDEGSLQRQPRPHPDRQGLARQATARPRRRSTTSSGAATASPARTGNFRRSATRSM